MRYVSAMAPPPPTLCPNPQTGTQHRRQRPLSGLCSDRFRLGGFGWASGDWECWHLHSLNLDIELGKRGSRFLLLYQSFTVRRDGLAFPHVLCTTIARAAARPVQE